MKYNESNKWLYIRLTLFTVIYAVVLSYFTYLGILMIKEIQNQGYVDLEIVRNILLLIIALFIVVYNAWKQHIYYVNLVHLSEDGSILLSGTKYYKKFSTSIVLKDYKYKLVTSYTTSIPAVGIELKSAKDSYYIYNNVLSDTELLEIYEHLKELYPENNLGKKWKFLFIGNTW